jgi:heme-degrading monooxygenase HmoA
MIMNKTCRWATCHWLRFGDIQTPDTLDLSRAPAGAASWKLGADGAAAPDGTRRPSNVWCGIALYPDETDAQRAFDDPAKFLPFLGGTVENWHALLLPIAHRGDCNHLDRDTPGPILAAQDDDPGGPLVVMTTAGFVIGPQLDMARVVDFRTNVDRIRTVVEASEGNVARQVFAPHTVGDDGVTMSVWRDDASMSAFAYRPGEHRAQIDRYKREQTADRTSFTRFRAVRTSGSWNGCCPVEAART